MVQITASPLKVAVTVNKQNYTCETIVKTGVLNVNCLTESAPFSTFERFGFKSGRTADKFGGENLKRSANGLVVLSENVNSFSLSRWKRNRFRHAYHVYMFGRRSG